VQVKVSIDGKDATEGTWLVIPANSSIELERFIRNGNLASGNRLKFIERTGKIEKHRGIEAEDGLIRIEYKTEKPAPIHVPIVHYDYYNVHVPYYRPNWWGAPYIYNGVQYICNNAPAYLSTQNAGLNQNVTFTSSSLGGGAFIGNVQHSGRPQASNSSAPASRLGGQRLKASHGIMRSMKSAAPADSDLGKYSFEFPVDSLECSFQEKNDAGITVAGGESNQQFQWTAGFETQPGSEVLVLRLRGEVGGKKVAKDVTVKTKPTCTSCGKKNRPTVKFCADCGTALTLI
jgi:hypothetical protein